ncbi:MAG: glycosyltransferase [Chloroflexia bacterium]|nr:glycosyltransferase [Chloroflexia bacterium]
MSISLICTVRDEAETIGALIDSMLAQHRLPDEIVINDCLSRDPTPEIVRAYAAREPRIRLVAGGNSISSGRNHAIREARGTIIACTDAGLRLDPGWLEAIVAPIERDEADLVGGFFEADPQSLFELTLGAVNYRNLDEIDPVTFMPFGKSMAFRRSLWEEAGGFPEWLSHCEDLVFAQAAEQAGFRRTFAPSALVYFRPRSSLGAFARQYYFYARGDGMAGLWPKRHAIRYLVYSSTALMLTAARYVPKLRGPSAALVALGLSAYTYRPYRRLLTRLKGRPGLEQLTALALVPVIRVVGDIAKMVGYPVGRLKRRRRKR